MAIMLKQIEETYEADAEEEAEELINKAKKDYNVIQSSITYKFLKKEKREYYVVKIKKSFVVEEFED